MIVNTPKEKKIMINNNNKVKFLKLIPDMKRSLVYVDEDMVRKILLIMIRLSLEYAAGKGYIYLKKDKLG